MQIPTPLIQSLQNIKDFDADAFLKSHNPELQVTSIRVNPAKPVPLHDFFSTSENVVSTPVPWSQYGYYLSTRPSFTFDPFLHAGCYYVQEASSMFLEQCLLQYIHSSKSIKVLDLCAAPGGKSTHIQSLISPDSLLVSNEVIRSRANILKENIIKWGCGNVVVTNNDPKDFTKLSGFFDIIVVDAPCSGSGLFRKDSEAIEEWSPNNVTLCSQRQQRILADVLPALKENGIIIYSTCSYSSEEDEQIVDWMVKEFPLSSFTIATEPNWGITPITTINQNHCYRFWPHKVKGEGFFIAVLQKNSQQKSTTLQSKTIIEKVSKKELAVIEEWVNCKNAIIVKKDTACYAWSEEHFANYQLCLQHLKVIYSGTFIGDLIRDKLVPGHSLAMNMALHSSQIKTIELNYEQAIAYLQKKELTIITAKGWQLAQYKNQPLGWINVLANRINNYYPKEWRILKARQ